MNPEQELKEIAHLIYQVANERIKKAQCQRRYQHAYFLHDQATGIQALGQPPLNRLDDLALRLCCKERTLASYFRQPSITEARIRLVKLAMQLYQIAPNEEHLYQSAVINARKFIDHHQRNTRNTQKRKTPCFPFTTRTTTAAAMPILP